MSRRKNGIIFIIIVFLCLLLLTQLMGDTSVNTPNVQENKQETGVPEDSNIILGSEDIELSAVVFMEPEQFRAMTGWNEEFQRLHPGTTITLTNISSEQSYPYIKEQASTGQGANIILLNNNWISEFAARGYLSYRANEFVKMDAGSTYHQKMVQTEWNGNTWAIPYSIDPYVVVWNPTLMVKEGDSEGELPNSLAEWLSLHQTLLLNDPTYEGIHVNASDVQAFISLIWALQGDWSKELDRIYTIDTDEDMDLLETIMSTTVSENTDELIRPLLSMQPLSTNEYWEKFNNKQFAAMVVPLSEWMVRQDRESAALSNSLLSGTSQNIGLWLSGTSFAVSSQTVQLEMAYAWITWMTNISRQMNMFEMTYMLPANITTLYSNNMLSLPQSELINNAVKGGQAWSHDPQLIIKMNLLQQAINDIAIDPSLIKVMNVQLEQIWKQINEAR